jgi:hypothetical protein
MKSLRKYIRTILKETLEEDYPQSFNMEEFKALRNFAQRIKYAEQRLQKIGSGSARTVYKIDDEKVLKLAKNQKGVSQNEVEIQQGGYYDTRDIVARVFDHDENNLWVEMELAQKMSKQDFKRITGFSFEDYAKVIHNYGVETGTNRGGFKWNVDKELVDKMWENEFTYEMLNYIAGYDIPTGDLERTSSYGIVKRDGHDAIVLVDFGFTKEVFSTHYDKSKRMAFYESEDKDEKTLFGFNIRIGGLENGIFNPDKEIFVTGNSAEEFMKNLDDQLIANGQPALEGDSRVKLYNKLTALEDKYRPKK